MREIIKKYSAVSLRLLLSEDTFTPKLFNSLAMSLTSSLVLHKMAMSFAFIEFVTTRSFSLFFLFGSDLFLSLTTHSSNKILTIPFANDL